ncbi:hypothetical protein [Variovorax sp. OV084]|uniref:hypothetical protein n=1 Tax=Variovorax sp. OV084 TaxID=1882777 RepID=UPI0015A6AA60|nr:hypothetical protein [Variovorax sp. OV084]
MADQALEGHDRARFDDHVGQRKVLPRCTFRRFGEIQPSLGRHAPLLVKTEPHHLINAFTRCQASTPRETSSESASRFRGCQVPFGVLRERLADMAVEKLSHRDWVPASSA